MIEDEFPDIKKLNCTPLIVTKGTQKYSRHRIDRLFRFRKILQVGLRRKNDYVVCNVNGMDNFFKKENNITIINKRSKSYGKFVLRFCDSVTKAIEHGNKYMAHLLTGGGVKLYVLGVYDKVVDKNMAVFYNSLIVTDIAEKARQEIEDEIGLQDGIIK